jgi:hypothetical protein
LPGFFSYSCKENVCKSVTNYKLESGSSRLSTFDSLGILLMAAIARLQA